MPDAAGRDGALRCPRRVQRRNIESDSCLGNEHSFSPLYAGWDIETQCPCQRERVPGFSFLSKRANVVHESKASFPLL